MSVLFTVTFLLARYDVLHIIGTQTTQRSNGKSLVTDIFRKYNCNLEVQTLLLSLQEILHQIRLQIGHQLLY